MSELVFECTSLKGFIDMNFCHTTYVCYNSFLVKTNKKKTKKKKEQTKKKLARIVITDPVMQGFYDAHVMLVLSNGSSVFRYRLGFVLQMCL